MPNHSNCKFRPNEKVSKLWRRGGIFTTSKICARTIYAQNAVPRSLIKAKLWKPNKMSNPLQLRNPPNHKAGAQLLQHVRDHWCSQFQPWNFAVFVTEANIDENKKCDSASLLIAFFCLLKMTLYLLFWGLEKQPKDPKACQIRAGSPPKTQRRVRDSGIGVSNLLLRHKGSKFTA